MENKSIKVNNQIIKPKVNFISKLVIYCSFILIIPIIWYIITQNSFKKMQQNIEETASGIDIQLKKRYDLLTKLIETAKQFIKFEKDLLKDIVSLRTQVQNVDEMSSVNAKMDRISRNINVQLENYPELKSTQTVVNLQLSIRECEDDISASRRFYNTAVRNYNQSLLTYPTNVVASNMHLETKIFFEASHNERKDVEVKFY